jgi:hypothetical protein
MAKDTTKTAPKPDKPEAPKPVPAAEPSAVKEILADVAEQISPIAALLASSCKARESGVYFNVWEVVPERATPRDNLLRREFWANVSQKFKPGDTIIAFPRDGAWYAEFIVWDAGQNWADVSPKGGMDRPEFGAVAGVADDFRIGNDPIDGVVITRRSTGAKVKGNFANHEEARRWLLDHQKALRN